MSLKTKTYLLYGAFAQSLVATLGSLYFSEIKHYNPCSLCWYQRIFMYPLVLIIGIGIIRKDKNIHTYVLPLSIVGWFISLYHNLLYYGIIHEAVVPCAVGVSCTTRFHAWFGFLTIPLLALIAFSVIIILTSVYKRGVVLEKSGV